MKTNLVLATIINLIRGNRPQAVNYLGQLAVLERNARHGSISRQLEQLAREADAAPAANPAGFLKRLTPAAVPEDGPPEYGTFLSIVPERTLQSLILPASVGTAAVTFIRGWKNRDALAEHGLPMASTLLLHGPSGNGKTSLAEAIANALELPFLIARGEQLIMSHVGESEKQISSAFDNLKKQPCVAFFDECDSFANTRTDGDGSSAQWCQLRAVNQTLLEIERAKKSQSLFVFATNGPERLDPAFRRRMDHELELPAPDDACRLELIDRLRRRWPIIAGGDWEETARSAENMAAIERLALEAAREIVLAQCA